MSDHKPDTPNQLRDGAHQMANGATQVASELKTRFTNDAVPVAKRAVSTAKSRFKAEREEAGGLVPLIKRRSPQLTAISAGMMFLGLILPIAKHGGGWVSYMTMPRSDWYVVTIMLLLTAGLSLLRVSKPRSHALLRWSTGVMAAIVFIGGLAASLPNISEHGLTPGILVIALSAIAVGAFGVITVIDKTEHTAQT